VPQAYVLAQNFPNPFNPSTTVQFSIPENSFVSLKIYDMTGKEVATLVGGLFGGANPNDARVQSLAEDFALPLGLVSIRSGAFALEAGDQVEQRRLAGPVRADDGEELAGFGGQVHFVEDARTAGLPGQADGAERGCGPGQGLSPSSG